MRLSSIILIKIAAHALLGQCDSFSQPPGMVLVEQVPCNNNTVCDDGRVIVYNDAIINYIERQQADNLGAEVDGAIIISQLMGEFGIDYESDDIELQANVLRSDQVQCNNGVTAELASYNYYRNSRGQAYYAQSATLSPNYDYSVLEANKDSFANDLSSILYFDSLNGCMSSLRWLSYSHNGRTSSVLIKTEPSQVGGICQPSMSRSAIYENFSGLLSSTMTKKWSSYCLSAQGNTGFRGDVKVIMTGVYNSCTINMDQVECYASSRS